MKTCLLVVAVLLSARVTSSIGQSTVLPKAEQLARSLEIDRAHFTYATLQEAVDYLDRKAREGAPANKNLHVSCGSLGRGLITFQFNNKSLYEVLQEISKQTGLPLRATADALYFPLPGEETPVKLADRPREEDNAREVVLRYLLSFRGPDVPHKMVTFLSVENKEPGDAFVARFADANIRKLNSKLLPGEQLACTAMVSGTAWLNDTTVQLNAGTISNGSGSGYCYEVTHTTKGWSVTKSTLDWQACR